MKNKIVPLLLIVILLVSVFIPVYAATQKELEEQKNQIEDKKEEAENKKEEVQGQINEVNEEIEK